MSWPSSLSLEGFYAAALWLHACHPRTLALNAAPVADFGYLKDLPELLHRIVHGGASTRTPGKKARLAGGGGFVGRCGRGRGGFLCRRGRGGGRFGSRDPRRGANHAHAHAPRTGTTEERVAASLEHDRGLAAAAAAARRTRRAEAAARAVEMYRTDPTYRFLHDRTADLFAGLLAEDMRKLADGKFREFSLATKWCPSLDSSYDRSTLLCEAVARRLFPKGSSLELAADLPDEHYAYRARERLRKAALVPLRHALKLPEVFISARAWESVAYTRVASVAMKNYKDLFLKHDADRFNAYLDDVKSGKKRIATGALLPTTHPICFAPPPAHGSHKWCRATSSSAPARAAGQQHSTAPVCPCARLCCWFGGHSTRWWRKREVRLLLVDLRKGKNRDRRSLLLQRNQRERATDLMQRRKDWPVAAGLPCLGFGARGCSLGKGAVAVEMLQ